MLDPDPISLALIKPGFRERFMSKLARSGDCLVYAGARNQLGYGLVSVNLNGEGGCASAHRLAWAFAHGPIKPGLFVCHRCDNPPCCNPEHLFLGTAQDNSNDMVAKGRSTKGRKARA